MLYSRDGIIKDSSLITIERDGKIIHNPSKSLLESEGWVEYTGQFSQFINKRFIKMTSDVLENFDEEELVDTIVFLTDNNKLYLNGQYFGGEDIVVSYDEYGSSNITYVGEVNINGNSFEIGVPYVHYNDYTGGTNIGQLVVGDNSYDVYAPQTHVDYQDLQGGGKKLGILNINGEEYPIYMPLIEEAPKLSQNVTIEELNNLKKESKLNSGQKYVVTDYRTKIDKNIGEVVYQENEKHELVFTALSKSELDNDVTSIQTFKSSSNVVGGLEPTGNFELIAYKCDWDPDNSCYTEDDEWYKYKGDTIEIDGVTHYIWTKYENGVPLLDREGYTMGKSRVVTSSLDFECSLDNPYHPDYVIYEDDSINDQYQFEEPSEDNENEGDFTDSFCRVERIDHPVYNYKVIADVCDWDHVNEVYGLDDSSWYVYCGDTIDIDGETYFIWYKPGIDPNYCCPLTNTLYLDCSVENPYKPELWMTTDGELDNEYFDPTKTDIFCGIKESNLPSLVQEIEVVDREPVITKVHADLNITKTFDESQVVNAVAFKTLADKNNSNYDKYLASYVDYESFHLYTGDTFEEGGTEYYVWDKWFGVGELVNGDYAIDEYGLYPQKLLTDKLYIDCSTNNPYNADYSLHSEDEVLENYQLSHFGDSFVDIHYFNNVTNYIRFKDNGWYVRCPELDRDSKFGWGYLSPYAESQDGNTYSWEGRSNEEDNYYGPIPRFLNNYDLSDNDYFLTDTEDPQVGDQFYYCDNEDNELDTIDKVWGTEIYPTIDYKGITYMKDEFGNEASYDFKHIQFEGLYTFGNETEDYSLDGFENKVYNNKIMKPVDKQYNRVNFSERNTFGNTIYPSVTDCVIDFEVKESLITKSELGLHVFDPTSFITPISVKPLVSRNQIIAYKTIDEQIVEPKSDAFGDANIISNTYE